VGNGLRATVGAARGRNRLTIKQDPGFARSAGTWAGEVAHKLLADHGLTPADIDLVVANPLVHEFRAALATRLGIPPGKLSGPADGPPVHTAGLAVALEAAGTGHGYGGRTLLLVSAGAGLMAGAALLRV
jgi:3-oxoacyl-[acyl-carrier-protein] synthase III